MVLKMINLIIFTLATCDILFSEVAASPEQKQLLEDLFINYRYNKIARPVLNESSRINVTVELYVGQINDVNEKYQTLSTMVWLTQRWRDEYLMWEPREYNNLTVLRIPASKIWLPDTVLYNTRQSNNDQLMTVETLTIVKSDGSVDWSAPLTMISECGINVYYYPFDQQECTLKMGSWQHDRKFIDYLDGAADSATEQHNGEWDTTSIKAHSNIKVYSCCPDKEYPDVTFTINISRKPLFYVVNLIVPCVMISMMSVLEFILPCNSGEKVSLGITVLLSLTVFMLVIAENMPATSDTIPVLARYYIITIFLVSFSTVMTVLVLSLHHRRSPLPRWVRHVFLRVLSSILCMKVESSKNASGSLYGQPTGPAGVHSSGLHFELVPQISNNESLSASATEYALKEETLLGSGDLCNDLDGGGLHGRSGGTTGLGTGGGGRGNGKGESGSCHRPYSWKDRSFMDIQNNVKFLASRYADRDQDEQITSDWQNVARVVDRFFLIIYIVCVVLMDVVMVLQVK
ncbi:neuronal acetylcholine receptor subunit alpha-10-like [Lytechinus pictus]|uniref:neuronal acetylcholine receptor subunit alpha-10-like n=1 Tax=Lytechinus pictus TaxID=7653 RepID=UPI00240DDF3F|nr:neuronal acetylcholine receptor subunit alpha-10-like [Lytechinus pictus]